MKKYFLAAGLGLFPLIFACSRSLPLTAKDMDNAVFKAEVKAAETQTLSFLGHIDSSIAAYYQAEKKIPKSLDALVPKYLFEIPIVELGLPTHHDTRTVAVYPPSILKNGKIDGRKIKDTGGWGYVVNGRQVIVFVDCTQPLKYPLSPSAPRFWYQQTGAQ
jgi:hypothetical protein